VDFKGLLDIKDMIMNSSKIISTVALACVFVVSAPAVFAEGTKAPGTGPNPFTDCGIGAALFKNTHWAAVSSNIIWDLGTTAVTSATLSPETCSAQNMQAAQFILQSYKGLAEETAKGKGENLTAMLDIYGCQQTQALTVISAVRADMAEQVGSAGYVSQSNVEKASAYYNSVSVAAQVCSA
jgi:hypothetical protein